MSNATKLPKISKPLNERIEETYTLESMGERFEVRTVMSREDNFGWYGWTVYVTAGNGASLMELGIAKHGTAARVVVRQYANRLVHKLNGVQ
jgi:transposase